MRISDWSSDVCSSDLRHRWLAVWLAGAALMMKVLVPAGFMPTVSSGAILVQLCSGQGLQTAMLEIPGQSGDHDPADHKQAEMPCAFSGLSSPALAAADPVLLDRKSTRLNSSH